MLGTVTHASTMGGWGRKIAVTPRPVWAMYCVTDRSRLQNETMPQKIKMNNLCQIESKSWLLVKRCLLFSSLSNAWDQNNVGDCWAPNKTVRSLLHCASYHSWNRGLQGFCLKLSAPNKGVWSPEDSKWGSEDGEAHGESKGGVLHRIERLQWPFPPGTRLMTVSKITWER